MSSSVQKISYLKNRLNISLLEQWSLFLLLFSIPISPAVPNLVGVFLILAWAFKRNYLADWNKLKSQPIFWAFLAYLLLYPLSILWSENYEWAYHLVERHMIYLIFPFVLLIIKKENIKYYFLAFVIGISFTGIVSYLMWFDLIAFEGAPGSGPTPFYTSTLYSPLLAWGIYLLMHSLFFEKCSNLKKSILVFFIIIMIINMFITGGRGGQLTFLILVVVLFMQFFHARGELFKGVVVGLMFSVISFTLAYQISDLFQQRVNLAVQEAKYFDGSPQGSVGARLSMYVHTVNMSFDREPLKIMFGSGIGDFPKDYNQHPSDHELFKLSASQEGHSHPHNTFLYQLGALGLVGLISLLAIFIAGIRFTLQNLDEFTHARWGFLIYAFVINLSDSMLLSHPTALLFIVFSAILFAKGRSV